MSSRERCDGLRCPGGPQSNRQFLPVVLIVTYAVRGINSDGCGGVVEFIPAVNGGAFSSILHKFVIEGSKAEPRNSAQPCTSRPTPKDSGDEANIRE